MIWSQATYVKWNESSCFFLLLLRRGSLLTNMTEQYFISIQSSSILFCRDREEEPEFMFIGGCWWGEEDARFLNFQAFRGFGNILWFFFSPLSYTLWVFFSSLIKNWFVSIFFQTELGVLWYRIWGLFNTPLWFRFFWQYRFQNEPNGSVRSGWTLFEIESLRRKNGFYAKCRCRSGEEEKSI